MDFTDSISLIQTTASVGRFAPEETSHLYYSWQIPKFLKSSKVSNSCRHAYFFSEVVFPFTTVLRLRHVNWTFIGCLEISRTCSTERTVEWTGKRSSAAANDLGSTHHCTSSGTDSGWFSSMRIHSSTGGECTLSRVFCGLRITPKFFATSLLSNLISGPLTTCWELEIAQLPLLNFWWTFWWNRSVCCVQILIMRPFRKRQTQRMSEFFSFFYSQPTHFELHFELCCMALNFLLIFLEMYMTLFWCLSRSVFSWLSNFLLLVSDASLATLFSSFNRLTCWGGQGLLCPLFWSTNYCQHFRSRYLRGPWELQFELHHELLARTLALLLRSLLVESFDSFAFASLHVALPTDRLLWSFSHFSLDGFIFLGPLTKLRTDKVCIFRSHLKSFRAVGLITWKAEDIGKKSWRGHFDFLQGLPLRRKWWLLRIFVLDVIDIC